MDKEETRVHWTTWSLGPLQEVKTVIPNERLNVLASEIDQVSVKLIWARFGSWLDESSD